MVDGLESLARERQAQLAEIRAELSRYPVKTRLSLTGPMVVARDIAQAMPVSGSFIGDSDAFLGMTVSVEVTSLAAPEHAPV